MNGGGVAMEFRSPVDPAEEAHYREVMDGMGVYDAQWALSKVLEHSDIEPGQNRLLLTRDMVRAGPIPKVFTELEELGEDGQNAEITVDVTAIDERGQEKDVHLRYLNSNRAYRVMGPRWRSFVVESGMTKGERLDLYTCMRGDGQRCLFFFMTKGWDASGSSAAWCTKVRKRRARQPAPAAVIDPDDDQVFLVNGGRADGDNGKHCGDVDYTPAKRDRRRRAKNGSHGRNQQDHILIVTNDGIHAWSGDFQDEASWDLDATPDEIEAAKGLLMLKYASLYAQRH